MSLSKSRASPEPGICLPHSYYRRPPCPRAILRSLLKLADREFRELTDRRPVPLPSRKFRPVKLNAAQFDQSWDRKRGAAARLTAVVLREDDAALERRVPLNRERSASFRARVEGLQLDAAVFSPMNRMDVSRGMRAECAAAGVVHESRSAICGARTVR